MPACLEHDARGYVFEAPAFQVPFELFSCVTTRGGLGAWRIPLECRYDIAHPNTALHAMAPCPEGESVIPEARCGPAEIAELTADGRNLTTGS